MAEKVHLLNHVRQIDEREGCWRGFAISILIRYGEDGRNVERTALSIL
jgi:hypothetical protein